MRDAIIIAAMFFLSAAAYYAGTMQAADRKLTRLRSACDVQEQWQREKLKPPFYEIGAN